MQLVLKLFNVVQKKKNIYECLMGNFEKFVVKLKTNFAQSLAASQAGTLILSRFYL